MTADKTLTPGGITDPMAAIIETVARLDSTIDHDELATVIATLVPQQARRSALANQLAARPDLLAGTGAHGSPAIIKLIEAQQARGVGRDHRPAVPVLPPDRRTDPQAMLG